MTIEKQLSDLADRVLELADRMDETFPNAKRQNLKVAIMAGMRDAIIQQLEEIKRPG